ncbi:MAG: phospholipase D-like domain-containing protein [Bacteroidia bacterium]
MITDHWNRKAKDYLIPHLQSAQKNVKIATGFFTVQGYDLLRESLGGKSVQIMVGFDENSRERLRQMLIADIMIHLSQWKVGNRREAVLDLVNRIQQGRFQITEHREGDWIDAKARNRDHAKLYILDDSITLIGSSNLTESGLIFNFEALGSIEKDDRVKFWLDKFNEYWHAETTIDLTEELLQALLAWLALRDPFDIYLKTILALVPQKTEEPPRESYKMPVRYQMVVIERLLRQLKEFRGAMLVASTGLGKTIMATHTALRLKQEELIFNVVIFSPLQVQPDWDKTMFSGGLSYKIFTRDLLDRPEPKGPGKIKDMEEAIRRLDDKCLIIIDESQYFRNKTRATDGAKRRAFKRLLPLIKEKKAFVLLLTATPYSKEVEDLNNQLMLLPHTAERKYIKDNGQFVFPGMIDEEISPNAGKYLIGLSFLRVL